MEYSKSGAETQNQYGVALESGQRFYERTSRETHVQYKLRGKIEKCQCGPCRVKNLDPATGRDQRERA